MAEVNADDRIRALQSAVGAIVDTQPPISTDNTDGAGPTRIRIFPSDNAVPENAPAGNPNLDSNTSTPGLTAPDGAAVGTGSVDTANALPSPTPSTNIDDQIDQKIQQLKQSLNAEGIPYTPQMEGGANFSPDDQHAAASAMQDMVAGFNISLAKGLALPRETVDRGLGMLGLDYMQHGSPTQNTIDAMNNMGISTYAVENLASKIGQGALPALATWAALQIAAPGMAVKQGVGVKDYLMREVGNWAIKHPWSGFILGQTGNAGGETAMHVVKPTTPLGKMSTELAGNLAGGMVPGVTKFLGGKIPFGKTAIKATGMGINAISEVLPTDLSNAIKKYNPFYKQPPAANRDPLFNPQIDANRIQNFSVDQIYQAQQLQEQAIEQAIHSIPRAGTPSQLQVRTHDLLQNAEKISKRIVSGFWERVPLKTKIAVNDMRSNTIAMKRELIDNDNTRPDVLMNKIIGETAPTRLPNGQFKPTVMTVAKLRDYQSQIGTAITEERAKDAPREGFVRNLARLSEIIDENIAGQLPNDTTIEQARQMSKRHNDLFSRGPINDILSKRRTGDFRVPQADSIDSLLNKTDGLAALKAVQEGVSSYPRIPTNKFQPRGYYASVTAVTPTEKDQLNQLVKSAEDSIRASFREAAEQGPGKAVAYSLKNEEAIKALSNVSGELAFAAQKIQAAMNAEKVMKASALAKFAETSGDKAVANLFAQKDPADMARQLMLRFRGDPEALEALRNEVLNRFIYTVGKTNPNIMQRMMQEPRYENLLQAVLSPDQFGRLTRMTNLAVRLGVDNEASFRQVLLSPAKTVGKIIGAYVGRKIETGTMQAPALVSARVGKWMEAMFGSTNPKDLLAQAVLDPNWEALLYSRVPTNAKEMRAAMINYRRILSGLNTSRKQAMDRFGDKNDE